MDVARENHRYIVHYPLYFCVLCCVSYAMPEYDVGKYLYFNCIKNVSVCEIHVISSFVLVFFHLYVPIISFVWRVFNGVLNLMRERNSRANQCAHSNSIHWQWTCVELNENVAVVSMNWRYATLTLKSEVCIIAKFNEISDYIYWNNWFWHSPAKKTDNQ